MMRMILDRRLWMKKVCLLLIHLLPCLLSSAFPSVISSNTSLQAHLTDSMVEQERLIQTLHEENTTRNTQYIHALFALSLVCIIPYTLTIVTAHTTLLSVLSTTSLVSTAYLLFILPPGVTAISFIDNLNAASLSASSRAQARSQVLRHFGIDEGPIRQYLPYLNLGLCGILVLLGMVVGRKVELWWGFSWLPASVYAVVLVAKYVMGSVDPESELGSLKYGFKGA
jgi:hypothetical protein